MTWITRQEVRDEDFKDPPYSDSRVDLAIATVEEYVEGKLGNWFDPRTLTLTLDGSGRDTLLLPHPIVSITSITIDTTAVDLDDVVVYNRHLSGMTRPDDRQNPKIVYKTPTSRTRSGGRWPRGRQNITVVGSFAYRDYDSGDATGKIPAALKRALFLLLPRFIETANSPYGQEAQKAHNLIENRTRSSSVQYQETHSVITGDPAVDQLLARMKAPMAGGLG